MYIDIGIMVGIKSFKLFESNQDIHEICKRYNIKDYSINPDSSIDVDGDVYLRDEKLSRLPLKFRNVSGYFECSNNQLTSLEGCPESVGGGFYCFNNQLTSLQGCPESVGEGFYCAHNQLTSLEGCPESVSGHFYCSYNQLTNLKGCPRSVSGGFYCSYNQLKTLQGCPESVDGDFYCHNNQLTSLEGCPESVGGGFYCSSNPVSEIYELFDTFKCIEWLNEYDVIQGDSVIMSRLEEVYHELGIEVPDEIELRNYRIVD